MVDDVGNVFVLGRTVARTRIIRPTSDVVRESDLDPSILQERVPDRLGHLERVTGKHIPPGTAILDILELEELRRLAICGEEFGQEVAGLVAVDDACPVPDEELSLLGHPILLVTTCYQFALPE